MGRCDFPQSIQDLELQGAEDSHYCDLLDRDDVQGVGLGQCQQAMDDDLPALRGMEGMQ